MDAKHLIATPSADLTDCLKVQTFYPFCECLAEKHELPYYNLVETLEEIYATLFEQHEDIEAANPWGCNDSVHKCPKMKGASREPKTKNAPRLFRVNQDASEHEQINQLANAIERADRDGVRLEAVIKRPEFGELILECGNSSPTHPSKKDKNEHGAHGVKHALESRHSISPKNIAEAIIQGEIKQHEGVASRLKITHKNFLIILEREQRKGSGRISETRAKLHTAMMRT